MSFEPLIPVGLSLFSSERGNKRWRKTKGERPFPRMKNTNICRIFRALFPQMDVLTLVPMCEPVRGCSCMCRPDGAALRNNAARGGGEENGLSNLDGKPRRTLRGPTSLQTLSKLPRIKRGLDGFGWRGRKTEGTTGKTLTRAGKRTLKERRGNVDCLAHFPQHRSILQCPRPFPTRDA